MPDEVRRRGLEVLDGVAPGGDGPGADLRRRLLAYEPGTPVDGYVWLSCALALEAMVAGNYGVGAVLVRGGEVVAEGRNRLVAPYVRTDRHAEMEAVDGFEERFREPGAAAGTTLYTSLECCPMCTVRLINTGIREVRYAAADPDGGMVSRWDGLPPFWQRLATRRDPPQRFGPADCDPELREVAGLIFRASDADLDARMAAR